jgi:small subunit ribosomal protein S1
MVNEGIDFAQDLEKLLDEHDFDTPQVGDIRKSIIVAISPQGVSVDLGLKRDGLILPSDLAKLDPEEREGLQLNDEVSVYIVDTEQPDSLVVSIYQARLNQDWVHAEEMMASGEIFEGEVMGYNRGGAIVPFGNLRGFVPASHLLDLRRGMDDQQKQQALTKLRGQKLPLKVIEVDRRRRRLVFSQRDAQKEWQEVRKERLIDQLQEGDVVKGRISGLRSFGAFVDLGGADGLIHISELAWHRVNHPREAVKVGDEFEVYVLGLDKDQQRIALSRKRLLPNPWSTVEERYREGQLVEGMVTRIVNYGAFVELEPGIEGLLHTSQLPYGPVEDPKEYIKEGETHLLRVVSVDTERQRIGLSLKAVTANEQIEWMAHREKEPPAEAKGKGRKERTAVEQPAAADTAQSEEAGVGEETLETPAPVSAAEIAAETETTEQPPAEAELETGMAVADEVVDDTEGATETEMEIDTAEEAGAEAVEATETVEATEAVEAAEAVDSAEEVEPTEDVEASETVEVSEAVKAAEAVDSAEEVEPTEDVEASDNGTAEAGDNIAEDDPEDTATETTEEVGL